MKRAEIVWIGGRLCHYGRVDLVFVLKVVVLAMRSCARGADVAVSMSENRLGLTSLSRIDRVPHTMAFWIGASFRLFNQLP